MRIIEKNISLNLIKIILNFGFVLITYFRFFEFWISIFVESIKGIVVEIIISSKRS